jgi:hypothetical protein
MDLHKIPTADAVLREIRARQQELERLKQVLRAAKAAEKLRAAQAEVSRYSRRAHGRGGAQ